MAIEAPPPVELRACFGSPLLDVMDFLNEAALRHPEAISFASGRPHDSTIAVGASLASLERFVDRRAAARGVPREAVMAEIGQYHRTAGIVNELIAGQLLADEGIDVRPEHVVVTNGAQEAMLALLLTLFDPASDVLLVTDPTYIGITGPAALLGIEVVGVPAGPEGIQPESVERAVTEVRRRGRRPRALYDVPDFNNPLGTTLSLEARRELLVVARRCSLLVFEDTPYRMFAYDGDRQPMLRALDDGGTVISIGSYAKTVYPGLRIGYAVAERDCAGRAGREPLARQLARVKSLTSVTTSPLAQAILGGVLLEHGGSLRRLVAPGLAFYRTNRDVMLAELERRLGGPSAPPRVRWNRPAGGFFVTVTLPFAFDAARLEECAARFGVIVCPMSAFTIGPGREDQVRLAFSAVTPEEIARGVERFACFVRSAAGEAGPPC